MRSIGMRSYKGHNTNVYRLAPSKTKKASYSEGSTVP